MKGEKISVITISYNSESTIRNTIESVLSQTYRPLEYVIVDGRSSDKTEEIIMSYRARLINSGIEFSYKSESDKGISDAFNKGIKRATGTIIGIINSDDQLAEDALTVIAESFDASVDVVCGDCLWIDKANKIEYIRKSKMDLNKLKYRMVLMHPTCFVRKKAYDIYGTFDINLKCVMDKDLLARFYKSGAKFKYVPSVLAIMSAGGVSDLNSQKVIEEGIEVAIKNGAPRFWVLARFSILAQKHKIIAWMKNNTKLWYLIKKGSKADDS